MPTLLETGKPLSAPAADSPLPRLTWWRQVGPALRHRIEYLITASVATAIAQTWFQTRTHIAAGDITPFVRDSLASSLRDLWGYQLTGAGSPSYEVARVFDVAILRAAEMLGMDAAMAQRVFYTGLVILTGIAGTYLAAAFTRRVAIRVAAGLWVVANPYWLVLIPNPIFLIAVAVGGLSAGFLIRAARGQPPRTTTVVLASTLLAPLSVNPPLLVIMVGWVLLLFSAGRLFGGPGGFRRTLSFSVRTLPWVLTINLFWIVPAFIVFATGSAVVAAEASAEAWSWSHAENTIPNVVGLNAHWGWAFPETYYPYAPRLESAWFNWMRFAVPALAATAPFLVRGRPRKIAATLLGTVGMAVFVGKGLHAPLADANRWLYEHIPGMWLLREPMSKVGWVIVLAYLIGAVIAADRLLDMSARRTGWRIPLTLVSVTIALAAFIYVHPLWTGEAIPDDRGHLPSSHVEIPAAWHEVADVVNGLDDTGTVLVLPLPEFYQTGHTWGYYGADELPTQLLTRRTMQPSAGGYYADPPAYSAAFRLLEEALVDQDHESTTRLLEALGVSIVVVRHDYDAEISQGDLANPDIIQAGLEALDHAELIHTTPVATVWQVSMARPRVSATINLVEIEPSIQADATATAIAATRPGIALVPAGLLPPVEEESSAWVVDPSRREIVLYEPADVVISMTPTAAPSWRLTPSDDSLEIAAVERLILDGTPAFWQDPIRQPTEGLPEAVSVGDRIIPLDGPTTAAIDTSESISVYAADRTIELEAPMDDQVGDCNAYDDRTPIEAGLDLDLLSDGVRLSAASHSACARYFLPSGADELLRITVDAHSVSGSPPRICVYSTTDEGCVAEDVLNTRSGELSALVPARSGLELYVYADEPGPDSEDSDTTAEYRQLRVDLLAATTTAELPEFPRRLTLQDLDQGTHQITSGPASSTPFELSDFSPLEDCYRHDDRTTEEAGLAFSEPTTGTVKLQASAHSACVSTALGAPQFARVNISLEYRAISGSSPRVCLWQVGPNECAQLPPLPRDAGWQEFTATTNLDLSADEVRVFLYADAPPEDVDYDTVVEYRNLTVSPATPWTAVVTTKPVLSRPIPLQVGSTPDRAAIQLPTEIPESPLVLILNDTFDENWRLTGADGGQHIQVDGWANGWLFNDATELAGANIVISYQPATWAYLAAATSAAALAIALLIHMTGWIRSLLKNLDRSSRGAHIV